MKQLGGAINNQNTNDNDSSGQGLSTVDKSTITINALMLHGQDNLNKPLQSLELLLSSRERH